VISKHSHKNGENLRKILIAVESLIQKNRKRKHCSKARYITVVSVVNEYQIPFNNSK
jgi:hypothetical protein